MQFIVFTPILVAHVSETHCIYEQVHLVSLIQLLFVFEYRPSSSNVDSLLRLRGRLLLDHEALSCLLVLLFVDEPKLNTSRLHRVLRNLCYHSQTRGWVIRSLLSILQRSSESELCLESSRLEESRGKRSLGQGSSSGGKGFLFFPAGRCILFVIVLLVIFPLWSCWTEWSHVVPVSSPGCLFQWMQPWDAGPTSFRSSGHRAENTRRSIQQEGAWAR